MKHGPVSGDRTQVIRLAGRNPYGLQHFSGPKRSLMNIYETGGNPFPSQIMLEQLFHLGYFFP